MLVTQTNLSIQLSELMSVLDKGGFRLLVNLCIGSCYRHRLRGGKRVGIGTVVVAILATDREVTLEQWIAEDKLRSPEIVCALGIAVDSALRFLASRRCGKLDGIARGFGIVEKSVDIQIDTQFS